MRLSRLPLTIVLLIMTCGLIAAGPPTSGATGKSSRAESKLANTEWRLASFGTPGGESPVAEGTTITIKFGADGRVGGSGGCNTYGGQYREQGANLSFSRIISTRRACVEQRANQQEQQYFAALASANNFKDSDSRLTVFYGGGSRALNFVNNVQSQPAEERYENVGNPVDLLASFYNAVNQRDYERAFGYWENPPGNFQDFAKGYRDTLSVQLIVQPPTRMDGAAGSVYAEVPTVIVARRSGGSERLFAGCYVTRKSNVRLPTRIPKGEVWRIYKGSLSPVVADAAIPKLLEQACTH